ncbi:NifU family protein, partial [candidate division KSB1 bacterium]
KKYRGIDVEHVEENEGKIICTCFGITEGKIEKTIRENDLKTVEEVTHYTKAGGGCGGCLTEIEDIIEKVRKEMTQDKKESMEPEKEKKLTNIQKIFMIQDTIDKEIREALKKDGGDIELIDVSENIVKVALRGSCSACPSAHFTLKDWVEAKLKEYVSEDLVVESVEE